LLSPTFLIRVFQLKLLQERPRHEADAEDAANGQTAAAGPSGSSGKPADNGHIGADVAGPSGSAGISRQNVAKIKKLEKALAECKRHIDLLEESEVDLVSVKICRRKIGVLAQMRLRKLAKMAENCDQNMEPG
jgi:hypothetical protein